MRIEYSVWAVLLTCATCLEYAIFVTARQVKRELNERSCGVRGADMPIESQIVGGQEASAPWPWMASINKNGYHTCGGSVLDRRHIISAAHCFDGANDPNIYTITYGSLNNTRTLNYKVHKIISHEDYSRPPGFHNDIALLILTGKLPSDIIPICLPENDNIGDTETLTITGFGTTKEGGGSSPTLQEVHGIPYINPEKCQEIMVNLMGKKALVTEKQVCTGDNEGGRGSCQGDSGGPVIHKLEDNSWELVGLVSYSIGCVRPGIPTVHTRLHAYKDWIERNMLIKRP